MLSAIERENIAKVGRTKGANSTYPLTGFEPNKYYYMTDIKEINVHANNGANGINSVKHPDLTIENLVSGYYDYNTNGFFITQETLNAQRNMITSDAPNVLNDYIELNIKFHNKRYIENLYMNLINYSRKLNLGAQYLISANGTTANNNLTNESFDLSLAHLSVTQNHIKPDENKNYKLSFDTIIDCSQIALYMSNNQVHPTIMLNNNKLTKNKYPNFINITEILINDEIASYDISSVQVLGKYDKDYSVSENIKNSITDNNYKWNADYLFVTQEATYENAYTYIDEHGTTRYYYKILLNLTKPIDVNSITLRFNNYATHLSNGFELFVGGAYYLSSSITEQTMAMPANINFGSTIHNCDEIDIYFSNNYLNSKPANGLTTLTTTQNDTDWIHPRTSNPNIVDFSYNRAGVNNWDYFWISKEATYTGLECSLPSKNENEKQTMLLFSLYDTTKTFGNDANITTNSVSPYWRFHFPAIYIQNDYIRWYGLFDGAERAFDIYDPSNQEQEAYGGTDSDTLLRRYKESEVSSIDYTANIYSHIGFDLSYGEGIGNDSIIPYVRLKSTGEKISLSTKIKDSNSLNTLDKYFKNLNHSNGYHAAISIYSAAGNTIDDVSMDKLSVEMFNPRIINKMSHGFNDTNPKIKNRYPFRNYTDTHFIGTNGVLVGPGSVGDGWDSFCWWSNEKTKKGFMFELIEGNIFKIGLTNNLYQGTDDAELQRNVEIAHSPPTGDGYVIYYHGTNDTLVVSHGILNSTSTEIKTTGGSSNYRPGSIDDSGSSSYRGWPLANIGYPKFAGIEVQDNGELMFFYQHDFYSPKIEMWREKLLQD